MPHGRRGAANPFPSAGTLTLNQATDFTLGTTHATIVGSVTGGQTLTLSSLSGGFSC